MKSTIVRPGIGLSIITKVFLASSEQSRRVIPMSSTTNVFRFVQDRRVHEK